MARESMAKKRERAAEVCARMALLYPDAECALHFHDPFSLVIAVLLSAQTTDAAVNRVTPVLFARWPDAAALACAPLGEVEEVLHPLGFFRSKAKHVVQTAQMVTAEFAGCVPNTMEELTRLPGVGRKTANIVLNNAFGIVEGIAVDTHVFRIATRLGFTSAKEPLDAEQDLLRLIPSELWGPVNHQWVLYGRQVCDAKKPACVAMEEIGGGDEAREAAGARTSEASAGAGADETSAIASRAGAEAGAGAAASGKASAIASKAGAGAGEADAEAKASAGVTAGMATETGKVGETTTSTAKPSKAGAGAVASKAAAKTQAFLDAIGTYPDASGREVWAATGAGFPCPLADLCPSRGTCLRASAKGGRAKGASKASKA